MTRLFRSFRYAFEGIFSAIKTETNWKIGFLEALVTIAASFYFKISQTDWIIIILLIGIVLASELINSAIETIVDSFTIHQHPKAKLAKDFSAGAVVIIIIASAIIGAIIFIPYLIPWLMLIGT